MVIAFTLAITFLIMGLNNQTLLVCTSTLILPSVSIFGNYARNAFESLLFLFIMHPFDVGDRISIEGVPLMVEVDNSSFLIITDLTHKSSNHIVTILFSSYWYFRARNPKPISLLHNKIICSKSFCN